MKYTITVIFIFFVQSLFAQADELNRIFEKYSYAKDDSLPVALQQSRKIIYPSSGNYARDNYFVASISWNKIDSIVLSDNSEADILVTVCGKFPIFVKCADTASCPTLFYNAEYSPLKKTNRIQFRFRSKNKNEKISLLTDVRAEIKQAFEKLNKGKITEHFRTLPFKGELYDHAVFKKETNTLLIIISYWGGNLIIPASDIANAERLQVKFINYGYPADTLDVVSFILYISGNNPVIMVRNDHPYFDPDIKLALEKINAGDTLTFSNIKVKGPDGIRTIDEFYLTVK